MATRKTKLLINLSRFAKFLKSLARSKRALFGIVILAFFSFIAIFGPLLTPYDPMEPPEMAHELALPTWYRLFNPNLTETEQVFKNPYYDNPMSLANGMLGEDWQVVKSDTVNVNYNGTVGSGKPGCIEISFGDAIQAENGTVTLTKRFQYNQAPPQRFFGPITYLAYAEKTEKCPVEKVQDIRKQWLSIEFRVYLTSVEDKKAYALIPTLLTDKTYPGPKPVREWRSEMHWILDDKSLIDSGSRYIKDAYGDEPQKVIFNRPGNFTYNIEATFKIGNPIYKDWVKNVKFFIDDTPFIIYGQTFGLLGTDAEKKDIFSQLVYGTRISMFIGLVAAIVSIALGLVVGLVSGFIGKALDEVLMRFTDMLLVIPHLPLLMVLVFALGANMINIIIVVGFLGWMGFARTVRSQVLSLKERPFIESAKASGAGLGYILRRHILPNVFTLVYVSLALSVPGAIISEAALSWLGLGPTEAMSWGRILFNFQSSGVVSQGALTYWYWTVFPGVCIALVSLSFILLGYAMDEILNPRLRQRR